MITGVLRPFSKKTGVKILSARVNKKQYKVKIMAYTGSLFEKAIIGIYITAG